jgi:hypothetical protein
MNGLTDVRFILDQKHDYDIGSEISIYLGNNVVGQAKVLSKNSTCCINHRTNDREQLYDYTFEISENLKASGHNKYTPYFNGAYGRLCVSDNELLRKQEKEMHQRNVDRVRKQDISFKYVCLSCETVIASSKEFKSTSCKHCRKGKLERVSNW